jgi:hypothetical protein
MRYGGRTDILLDEDELADELELAGLCSDSAVAALGNVIVQGPQGFLQS